jgi:hypothetical protein
MVTRLCSSGPVGGEAEHGGVASERVVGQCCLPHGRREAERDSKRQGT